MRHGNCYVCDHHTHLSNRGRCADCERDRARENERENDKLREQLAKSEQYIYDLTNADTGEVPTLEAQLAAAESQIDALMLEYCPDEMSKEQLDNWEKHQRPVDDTMEGRRSMGDGVGCRCAARSKVECFCEGVDWRSSREIELEVRCTRRGNLNFWEWVGE